MNFGALGRQCQPQNADGSIPVTKRFLKPAKGQSKKLPAGISIWVQAHKVTN